MPLSEVSGEGLLTKIMKAVQVHITKGHALSALEKVGKTGIAFDFHLLSNTRNTKVTVNKQNSL